MVLMLVPRTRVPLIRPSIPRFPSFVDLRFLTHAQHFGSIHPSYPSYPHPFPQKGGRRWKMEYYINPEDSMSELFSSPLEEIVLTPL